MHSARAAAARAAPCPQLAVWTRSSDGSEGGLPWFSRYTDEEGFGLFFLPIK
jgi:hypothetical protein